MADWTIKESDTAPAYLDTLTLADGSVPEFSGASLAFVMSSAAGTPVTLTGTVSIVNTTTGAVRYDPSLADTQGRAGQYMATWRLTSADGTTMSFPTVGYISVTVEPNPVTSSTAQLVGLPELKDYLRISDSDHTLDNRLLSDIRAVAPIVENITGPIIVRTFDEFHMGGGPTVQVRRRPSSTYGTSPVLELLTCSEDLGSSTYPLTIVDGPHLGTSYSCMIDAIGTITRLGGGGGYQAFAGGLDSVHITYQAGQETVPENVRRGTLELLRVNYQTTRPAGAGRRTVADDQPVNQDRSFFMPEGVERLLAPNRRAPSIA